MRRLILLILMFAGVAVAPFVCCRAAVPVAAEADTTVSISLLTCSPGVATYELYGHTAIRVRSEARRFDAVFNYGVFDFAQPHFVWRFVLGECDYMVFPYSYSAFMSDYARRGSSVTEQVLNLLPAELHGLERALWRAISVQERVYRYDIFRSNCTTKARDIIEANLLGHVVYPARARRNTFRTILHRYTGDHSWSAEGNDLLLGAAVDTLISERDEMFAPEYLMWYFDSAFVDRGYHRYDPLVRERRVLLAADAALHREAESAEPSFPLPPVVLWWGVFVLCCCSSAYELRRRRALWGIDAVLMTAQGLAGVLLAFMSLFSAHPGVSHNWQVWLLNPLPLFFVWPVVRSSRRCCLCYYHYVAGALTLLFVVMYPFLPQDFSTLMLPLAFLLLCRSLTHVALYRRRTS